VSADRFVTLVFFVVQCWPSVPAMEFTTKRTKFTKLNSWQQNNILFMRS
jgi:hypothetical protein